MAEDTSTLKPQASQEQLTHIKNTDRLGRPVKHGCYKTPEYSVWRSMRHRCRCPKATAYQRYGGRQDAEQALARGLRFIHEQDARLEELGSA